MNNRYLKQLIFGCGAECYGIFCGLGKIQQEHGIFLTIAEHLKNSGDMFFCEKIQTELLDFQFKDNSNKTITKAKNIQFPLCSLENESEFEISEDPLNKCFELLLHALDLGNSNKQTLNCEFNSLLDLKGDNIVNDIVVCNIFKIILLKYHLIRKEPLGLIVLRVFMTINLKFLQLTPLFEGFLATLISDITMKYANNFQHQYSDYDFSIELINTPAFTIKDYVNLTKKLIEFLDQHQKPFVRTNNVFEDLLNSLKILHVFNENLKIFSYKCFYLNNICKYLNFKEEYRQYKANAKTIFNYIFVLPIETKTEFLRLESSDLMKSSLQDAFFRSLYEGPTFPYFFVHVSRESIFSDLRKHLVDSCVQNFKKQLKVSFQGEEGVDNGGIRKEFFQLLSEYLIEESGLLIEKNHLIWLNPSNRDFNAFKDLGIILGMALYNDVILNIPFPKLFFKKLLKKKIELEDLSEIEPAIYTSLSNLKNSSQQELEEADLSFEITYEKEKDKFITVPLIKKSNTQVTLLNIDLFIKKYVDFISNYSIRKQFHALKKGFDLIIPPARIYFLHYDELEKIIVGCSYININELRSRSVLKEFKPTDLAVKFFWEIFEEYSALDQKKLLQFITGNERIPIFDSKNFKLTIMRNGCDSDRLPSSQTCFNTFLLPEYDTKEKMKEKIDKAISMTKGFYLL